MKNILYSSRLDDMFKNVTSSNFNLTQYISNRNDLRSINDLYKKETDLMQKLTHSYEFRRKMKKKKNKGNFNQLTDVALGYMSNKNLKEDSSKSVTYIDKEEKPGNIIFKSKKNKLKSKLKLTFDLNKIYDTELDSNDNMCCSTTSRSLGIFYKPSPRYLNPTKKGSCQKLIQVGDKQIEVRKKEVLEKINNIIDNKTGKKITKPISPTKSKATYESITSPRKSDTRSIVLKTGTAVNNYLMRDFQIGDAVDPVQASKRKFSITQRFFHEKDEKKKAEQIKQLEHYGKMTGKQVFTDKLYEEKEDSFVSNISEEQLDNYIQMHKEFKVKEKKKAFERSRNMVQMIENLAHSDYEKMKPKKNLINLHNLNRVIRLRNIVKHKNDPVDDNFEFRKIEKFKENARIDNNKVIKALDKLGPPSFLKTKFKNETIRTFKVINGKYFGCAV